MSDRFVSKIESTIESRKEGTHGGCSVDCMLEVVRRMKMRYQRTGGISTAIARRREGFNRSTSGKLGNQSLFNFMLRPGDLTLTSLSDSFGDPGLLAGTTTSIAHGSCRRIGLRRRAELLPSKVYLLGKVKT